MRMLQSGRFNDKKILLIDKEAKAKNDRTWCFWEKENGFFENIVHKQWSTISFLSDDFSAAMNIAPYNYKMIRGADFYEHCFTVIKNKQHIEVAYADIQNPLIKKGNLHLSLNGVTAVIEAGLVFNSIYHSAKTGSQAINLLQHFKGWVIETPAPFFADDQATMMDFRVHQKHGTTFAYVLPVSSTTALVEYTLFTKELLQQQQYTDELNSYIKTFLGISNYAVKEEEFGIIPMTNERFPFYQQGIYNIGTAGGNTKASSGYTFQFIQKQSDAIVNCLLEGKSPSHIPATPKRFRFYDNTLLHILYHNRLPGKYIFTRLFKKNKPQQVLRFLDNETSLKQELRIISSLPTWPFLKAALQQL